MIICKECRCFHPITVSDIYCGECCIGDTRNPIAINENITGCCLYEPKQPKKLKLLTNGDIVRQMTDEELADVMQGQCACCAYQLTGCTERECKDGAYKWLKQEKADYFDFDKRSEITNFEKENKGGE